VCGEARLIRAPARTNSRIYPLREPYETAAEIGLYSENNVATAAFGAMPPITLLPRKRLVLPQRKCRGLILPRVRRIEITRGPTTARWRRHAI
jgi:hypothetical protein